MVKMPENHFPTFSFNPATLMYISFIMGSAALETALMTTISLAMVEQVIAQSTDTALAKYIELTEQEITESDAAKVSS
jgi:hypothetical protein